MSLNSYNPYDRYRGRTTQKVLHMLSLVLIVGVSLAVGFWLGQQNAKYAAGTLAEENEDIRRQKADAIEEVTKLRADAQTAGLKLAQMQQHYSDEIGSGPLPGLVELLRGQLEAGVRPERLESAIRTALPPQKCSATQSAKMIVDTPAYKGAAAAISAAEGNVMMSAQGQSARNERGEPEAWFDPSMPVAVTFTSQGTKPEVKEGTLPLHHSVIVGDTEYRFTLSEGAASYIDVTYDSCPYP